MIEDIIKKYEETADFTKQENKDVEKFFKEDLDCKFVPNGVLEFYKKYDGCMLSVNDIFSLQEIEEEMADYFKSFLKGMGIDSEERYVPIANDGMGGYFVFLSDKDEEIIYYLDHEFPDERTTFDSFEEFLEEQLSMDSDL